MTYQLTLPNGSVSISETLLPPRRLDWRYSGFEWVRKGINEKGYEVMVLKSPRFRITFCSEYGEVTYSNEELPDELPPIPPVRGKKGRWDVPNFSKSDVRIRPVYTPTVYKAAFVDRIRTRVVAFDLDSGIVEPRVSQISGYRARWPPYSKELRDMEVVAEYEPIRIDFVLDGRTVSQTAEDLDPPELDQVDGYTVYWPIPDDLGQEDLVLRSVKEPIVHRVTLHEFDGDTTVDFSIESPFVPRPPTPRAGYRCSWDREAVPSLMEDQEITAVYDPIEIRYHLSETVFFSTRHGDGVSIPAATHYQWQNINPRDVGIDVRPVPRLEFALFYSGGDLVYCVPYRIDDTHYLDEVRERDTAPLYQRTNGVWAESDERPGYLTYTADYSAGSVEHEPDPVDPRWGLESCADGIFDRGGTITLNDRTYDLLYTEYSSITGVTKDNLHSLISLPLDQWLEREHIPHYNGIRGLSDCRARSDGTYNVRSDGCFWAGYLDRFSDAFEFLESQDIYFRAPKRENHMFGGMGSRYLDLDSQYDIVEDDQGKVLTIDLEKPIPSRAMEHLRTEFRRPAPDAPAVAPASMDADTIRDARRSNARIEHIFMDVEHPECEFDVLEDGSLTLRRYLGRSSEYEVPRMAVPDGEGPLRTVTRISDGAFAGNECIVSVFVPGTVRAIGDRAFRDCGYLRTVELGVGLEAIGAGSFQGCASLSEIEVPVSVRAIGEGAFDRSTTVVGSAAAGSGVPEGDPIGRFLGSLELCEYDYLKDLCLGRDPQGALEKYGKRERPVRNQINSRFIDAFGEDDGLIDANGDVSGDHLGELIDHFRDDASSDPESIGMCGESANAARAADAKAAGYGDVTDPVMTRPKRGAEASATEPPEDDASPDASVDRGATHSETHREGTHMPESRKTSMPPKKVAYNILNAYRGGVSNLEGVEYTAFGRDTEVARFDQTLKMTKEGSGRMEALVGPYGIGKSFILALFQVLATKKGFVVMSADITASKWFAGTVSEKQGLNLYRDLIKSTAVKGCNRDAFDLILEQWYEDLKEETGGGLSEIAEEFNRRTRDCWSLTQYNDIRAAILARFREFENDDPSPLSQDFFLANLTKKTDAQAIGAKDYIRDPRWFEIMNTYSHLFVHAGYKGLILLFDQTDALLNLPRINRQQNYEALLAMWNSINEGRTEHLSAVLFAADSLIDDQKRGTFQYKALDDRIKGATRLQVLPNEYMVALLERLREIHEYANAWELGISDEETRRFAEAMLSNTGMGRSCIRPVCVAWVKRLDDELAGRDEPEDVYIEVAKRESEKAGDDGALPERFPEDRDGDR